jgi:hypothetical protein
MIGHIFYIAGMVDRNNISDGSGGFPVYKKSHRDGNEDKMEDAWRADAYDAGDRYNLIN